MSQVAQDDSVRAHAICEDELDSDYYIYHGKNRKEVLSFLLITVFTPLVLVILTGIIVRGGHKGIKNQFKDSSNHKNIAGIVLTGVFVTLYTLVCDALAAYYAICNQHELSNIHVLKQLNIASTCLLLLLNSTFSLVPLLAVFFYVCCYNCATVEQNLSKCNQQCGKHCFNCFFSVAFGPSANHEGVWDKKNHLNYSPHSSKTHCPHTPTPKAPLSLGTSKEIPLEHRWSHR